MASCHSPFLPSIFFPGTYTWLGTPWYLDLSLNVASSERVSLTSESTIGTPFSHSCNPFELSEEPLLWDVWLAD